MRSILLRFRTMNKRHNPVILFRTDMASRLRITTVDLVMVCFFLITFYYTTKKTKKNDKDKATWDE